MGAGEWRFPPKRVMVSYLSLAGESKCAINQAFCGLQACRQSSRTFLFSPSSRSKLQKQRRHSRSDHEKSFLTCVSEQQVVVSFGFTMMAYQRSLVLLGCLAVASAFHVSPVTPLARSRALKMAKAVDDEVIVKKVKEIYHDSSKTDYDDMITGIFPGALSNAELETNVVKALSKKGYTSDNTLLATSLCCDELARRLEDDFVKVYGNNFNLGGLSGFPFAGNTGFGAMAAHIPDDGSCLVVYGPHVGVATTGQVGKVERAGIALVDSCCGSAIAASNYLKGITEGGAQITTKIQEFTDFQQGVVQELILPHGKRLADAEDRMVELPYALYESQDLLMADIVQTGCGGVRNNIALLGGIQINTAPMAMDYFLPLRFDYMDNEGNVLEDMLESITGY